MDYRYIIEKNKLTEEMLTDSQRDFIRGMKCVAGIVEGEMNYLDDSIAAGEFDDYVLNKVEAQVKSQALAEILEAITGCIDEAVVAFVDDRISKGEIELPEEPTVSEKYGDFAVLLPSEMEQAAAKNEGKELSEEGEKVRLTGATRYFFDNPYVEVYQKDSDKTMWVPEDRIRPIE